MMKKSFWILISATVCFLIIAIGPYEVSKSVLISYLHSGGLVQKVMLLRSLSGYFALSLILIQLLIGFFIKYWTKVFGKGILSVHKIITVFLIFFVIIHPLTFVLINFKIKGILDPFYVFTDVCVMCKNIFEFNYTFGRISFWLIIFTVLAKLIPSEGWFKKYSKNIHALNYLAFIFILLHLLIR
jgi:predicted ferric reductase